MNNQQHLLGELSRLLNQKKSKKFYAQRLGISVKHVEDLLNKLRSASFSTKPTHIVEEKDDYISGSKTITVQSDRPLSPKEIEELAQVDNINTFVERSWLKSHKSGIWTYSICTATRINNFYNKEQLTKKLKELLPDYTPKKLPIRKFPVSEKALFIYLSDDHAGAINEASIFDNSYSGADYVDRLLHILDVLKQENISYEQVVVVSLGDQLNGWNEQTTRGGHIVKSESNKKQFDIYVQARMIFYNELFNSGLSENYLIYNLENSNHSGLGFSYMANKALEFYIQGKFPEVKTYSTDKSIDILEYGDHIFAYTHGKDEKQQKTPFPLNLNDRTDAFFCQFFDKHGFSARKKHRHIIKGDLHQYNVNYGKSGRYVNMPSIMGSSDYSEINFGNTQAGAVVEIVNKNSNIINSIPIWF